MFSLRQVRCDEGNSRCEQVTRLEQFITNTTISVTSNSHAGRNATNALLMGHLIATVYLKTAHAAPAAPRDAHVRSAQDQNISRKSLRRVVSPQQYLSTSASLPLIQRQTWLKGTKTSAQPQMVYQSRVPTPCNHLTLSTSVHLCRRRLSIPTLVRFCHSTFVFCSLRGSTEHLN